MPHLPCRGSTAAGFATLLLLGPSVLTASVPAVTGTGGLVRGLVVSMGPARTSTGPGATLVPGSALPLDLTVANPYPRTVRITALDVRVDEVQPRRPGGCPAADFATSAGRFRPVDLPPRRATTLSQAGVASPEWPSVTMTASASAQDGCRDVVLLLAFTLRGRLA